MFVKQSTHTKISLNITKPANSRGVEGKALHINPAFERPSTHKIKTVLQLRDISKSVKILQEGRTGRESHGQKPGNGIRDNRCAKTSS